MKKMQIGNANVLCNAVESSLDPPNYIAAMKTAAPEQWKVVIEDELKSLRDNRTWVAILSCLANNIYYAPEKNIRQSIRPCSRSGS